MLLARSRLSTAQPPLRHRLRVTAVDSKSHNLQHSNTIGPSTSPPDPTTGGRERFPCLSAQYTYYRPSFGIFLVVVSVGPVPSNSLPLALNTCSSFLNSHRVCLQKSTNTTLPLHSKPYTIPTNPQPQSRDDDDDVVDIQLLS